MDLPDFDPLLQAIAPGIFLTFAALALSVAAALVTDGITHVVTWVAGGPERRKARQIAVMRTLILEWKEDDPPPDPAHGGR